MMDSQETHPEEATPVAADWTEGLDFGPLPPPELLRDYELYSPGSAAKILDLARERGEHRRRLEEQRVRLGEERMKADLILTTTAALLGMVLAGAFVVYGFYALGHSNREQLFLFMSTLAGLFGGLFSSAMAWLFRTNAAAHQAIGREYPSHAPTTRRKPAHG